MAVPALAASAAYVQSALGVSPSLTAVAGAVPTLLDPLSTMILGSIVGATVAIGLARDRSTETDAGAIKRMFLNFGISLGCGVIVTPGFFRYYSIPFDAELVGPVALLIAASAVGLLNRLLPVIKTRATRLFNSFK